MTKPWITVARAELQVQTSKFRAHRKTTIIVLYCIGILTAFIIIPAIMTYLIKRYLLFPDFLLIPTMPGLMRVLIMLFWLNIIIMPIPTALQEKKIDQWEILLSHNIKTRDLMLGTFIGKLPIYGLLVLYLAPAFISPFILTFKVSLFGQAVIYLTLFLITISTTWLSNLLITAIHSKLGESPRGKDLSNALAVILVLLTILPMYAVWFFADVFATIFNMHIFNVLPFSWEADLLSWLIIIFNGINLSPPVLTQMQTTLAFNLLTSILLLGGFIVLIFLLGLFSADRLFTHNLGPRNETVITIVKENLFYRIIRRIAPGPSGTLLVTTLKDFGRKAQNLSELTFAIVLATAFPLIINFAFRHILGHMVLFQIIYTTGVMLAFVSVSIFGGIAFLESKDHLWAIQSAPKGVTKFIKARIAETLIFTIPISVIPSLITTLIVGLKLADLAITIAFTYIICTSAALIGIGVTACNPTYEDANSEAFRINGFICTIITGVAIFSPVFIILFLDKGLGLTPFLGALLTNTVINITINIAPLITFGVLTLYIGAKRLAHLE